MKKIKIVILVTFAYALFACSTASNTQGSIPDSESAILSLLMKDSDVASYECKWVNTLLDQTHDPNDFQAKGSDESAKRILDGTCFRVGETPFHVTLRHELYLYKTSEPAEIGSYLVSLSQDADWRNFDLGLTSKHESISKCASYKGSEYQDCFYVSQYNQIVSVVWINSSSKLPDAHLRSIAIDIIRSIEKRVSDFIHDS